MAGPLSCFLHIFAPSLHNTNTDRAIRQHWNLECVHKSQKGSKHSTGKVDELLCWWETWSGAQSLQYIFSRIQLYLPTYRFYTCRCTAIYVHVKNMPLFLRREFAHAGENNFNFVDAEPSLLFQTTQSLQVHQVQWSKLIYNPRLLVIWVDTACWSVYRKLILCLSHVHIYVHPCSPQFDPTWSHVCRM